MGKVESGRTFAVIFTGTVPPEVPEGSEATYCLPFFTTNVAAQSAGAIRSCAVRVDDRDAVELAAALGGDHRKKLKLS